MRKRQLENTFKITLRNNGSVSFNGDLESLSSDQAREKLHYVASKLKSLDGHAYVSAVKQLKFHSNTIQQLIQVAASDYEELNHLPSYEFFTLVNDLNDLYVVGTSRIHDSIRCIADVMGERLQYERNPHYRLLNCYAASRFALNCFQGDKDNIDLIEDVVKELHAPDRTSWKTLLDQLQSLDDLNLLAGVLYHFAALREYNPNNIKQLLQAADRIAAKYLAQLTQKPELVATLENVIQFRQAMSFFRHHEKCKLSIPTHLNQVTRLVQKHLQKNNKASPSEAQHEVKRKLDEFLCASGDKGWKPSQMEKYLMGYRVDVVAINKELKQAVIVEVDGSQHYYKCGKSETLRPLDVFKHKVFANGLIEKGFTVLKLRIKAEDVGRLEFATTSRRTKGKWNYVAGNKTNSHTMYTKRDAGLEPMNVRLFSLLQSEHRRQTALKVESGRCGDPLEHRSHLRPGFIYS